MTIAIIGGGAAGVAAAIAAAEQGARAVVLERNRKPLKKLGVTGNGRGNLLNTGEPRYFGSPQFAAQILGTQGPAAVMEFFRALGVPLREEAEGRWYPAAFQASVAVEALLLRAAQLGVEWRLLTRVTAVERSGDGFLLHATQSAPEGSEQVGKGKTVRKAAAYAAENPAEELITLHAERVLVTVGGAAAPAHGTDGTGYGLLTAFGHTVTPLRPALCALRTDPRRIAGLSGQRARARLRLLDANGAPLRETGGEVLFGEDAVSGIAAMQLARYVPEGTELRMDLRPAGGWACETSDEPGADPETIAAELKALAVRRQGLAIGDLLTGTYPPPLARFLCREAGLPGPSAPLAALLPGDFQRLAQTITGARLPITGTRGMEQAQVTAGGVRTRDFDPATLESRLCRGLYAAGEVLDVDGDCGGYNLLFAFASGLLAGRAATR